VKFQNQQSLPAAQAGTGQVISPTSRLSARARFYSHTPFSRIFPTPKLNSEKKIRFTVNLRKVMNFTK